MNIKRNKSQYRANFLFGKMDGSIEEAGYEFANAKTELYRKSWWKILKRRIVLTYLGHGPTKSQVNAALIASAPDLLATLKVALKGYTDLEEVVPIPDEMKMIIALCRKAIAKAEQF